MDFPIKYIANTLSCTQHKYFQYYYTMCVFITRDYLNHFIKNPHSLIVKILGVFSIQQANQKPVFFFLMQSVFYPDTMVSLR